MSRPDALMTAHALTRQDRNADYGTPRTNWQATADIWTAMLSARGLLKPDAAITADMAALLMVGVKLARESFKHKPDNLVDAAGYIDIAERCLYGEEGVARTCSAPGAAQIAHNDGHTADGGGVIPHTLAMEAMRDGAVPPDDDEVTFPRACPAGGCGED